MSDLVLPASSSDWKETGRKLEGKKVYDSKLLMYFLPILPILPVRLPANKTHLWKFSR
jgi:hypothetical protein